MEKRIRRAKIHALYRPGKVNFCMRTDTSKDVPWLNVNGLWLEQAGFGIGDQIEIDVSTNQLVIKKVTVTVQNEDN